MDMRVSSVAPCKPLFAHSSLPLLVQPGLPDQALRRVLPALHQVVEDELPRSGALLLRGFQSFGEQDLAAFVRSFGHLPFRRTLAAPETAPQDALALHNEQSDAALWPMKLWFHCLQAGGEVILADGREVYRRLDFSLRKRFASKRLMYVRNFGNGLDVPWQTAFATSDRNLVEGILRARQIHYEWKGDGQLRTRQVAQAVACHPGTGELVWFNQAHVWHFSSLPAVQQANLLAILPSSLDLPRHVYYGDGSELEPDALAQIRGVLDECSVAFAWEKGDVLMLDNMLTLHGRSHHAGPRRVLMAMAEGAPQVIA